MKKNPNLNILRNPHRPHLRVQTGKTWAVNENNISIINNNPLKVSEHGLNGNENGNEQVANIKLASNFHKNSSLSISLSLEDKLLTSDTLTQDNLTNDSLSIDESSSDKLSQEFLSMVNLAKDKKAKARRSRDKISPDSLSRDSFAMVELSRDKLSTIKINWEELNCSSKLFDFYGENHRKLMRHIRRRKMELDQKEFYITRRDAKDRDGVVERHFGKCLRDLGADGFFYWELRLVRGLPVYWLKLP